ncbi:MAG: rubrerythrin family protein [Lachnospiraceae bacterium]|nr:rubrerythrin family protein [Lachnospiraceae bacterium]
MAVDFKESKTKENLMKAFAGESQARNRYNIAADKAHERNLHVLEEVFKFTAEQERAHAKVFYEFLTEFSGENIPIEGTYPVDISESLEELLGMAEHNEREEHENVYREFSEVARQEGFEKIAGTFFMIGNVEKIHAERFAKFKKWMEENRLFISDVSTTWMCLNCGHVIDSKNAPEFCPVCGEEQGYFVRIEMAPYSSGTFGIGK